MLRALFDAGLHGKGFDGDGGVQSKRDTSRSSAEERHIRGSDASYSNSTLTDSRLSITGLIGGAFWYVSSIASSDQTDVIEFTPASPHVPGAVVWFGLGLFVLLGLFTHLMNGNSLGEYLARGAVFAGAVFAIFGGIALLRKVGRRHLRLGADGVRIRRWGRDKFFPWPAVRKLSYGTSHRMYLDTDEGKWVIGTAALTGRSRSPLVMAGTTWAARIGRVELEGVILAAKAHYKVHHKDTPARCEPVLEGLEPAEWEHALKRAMDSSDYRVRGLAPSDLLADLETPSLSPDLRAAIARVISPSEAQRLRAVLHSTAAPQVLEALEHTLAKIRPVRAEVQSVPAQDEVEAVDAPSVKENEA